MKEAKDFLGEIRGVIGVAGVHFGGKLFDEKRLKHFNQELIDKVCLNHLKQLVQIG